MKRYFLGERRGQPLMIENAAGAYVDFDAAQAVVTALAECQERHRVNADWKAKHQALEAALAQAYCQHGYRLSEREQCFECNTFPENAEIKS